MEDTEEVNQFFNPDKTLSDFPLTIEAVLPKHRKSPYKYHITSTGTLINASKGSHIKVFKDAAGFQRVEYAYFNEEGKTMRDTSLLAEIMVLSFFHGHYNEELMKVVRHDQHRASDHIHNLVPIFNLAQLQSYFIYRLGEITGEHFRVVVSKRPDEYTLERYLASDNGTFFSLSRLLFMKPNTGKYATYHFEPSFRELNHGADIRRLTGHSLIATTFIGEIPPDHHVHHINGHSRDNQKSNLQILPASEHRKLHSNYQIRNEDTDIKKTCTICLEQDDQAVWCACERGYCAAHWGEHSESCWYHQHDSDAEFNAFVPLKWGTKVVSGFSINRKGQIKGPTGSIRHTTLSNGYPCIGLAKSMGARFVHRIMGDTFFKTELDRIKDGVMDHINSNRRLNHVKNLRPVTQQQNNIYASGCNVVVENRKTGARVYYETIANCADAFNTLYPKLYVELCHAEKTVIKEGHVFNRDPKRRFTVDSFYID